MTKVACRACGTATDRNVTTAVARDYFGRPQAEYDAGVCPACEDLRLDEPGSEVRAALRLLGKDEADYALAAEAFADAPPVLYERAKPQRKPWQHVDRETKAELKRAYVRVLDARVHASADHDRPVPPHAPPEGTQYRACLACGVARSEQWRGPTHTGAFTKPGMASGYLCAACGEAAEAAGALGPEMLERALLAARGRDYVPGMTIPGLRAWASQADPRPQDVGWAHVGEVREPEPDLDPLLALQVAVRDLSAKVEALEARLP